MDPTLPELLADPVNRSPVTLEGDTLRGPGGRTYPISTGFRGLRAPGTLVTADRGELRFQVDETRLVRFGRHEPGAAHHCVEYAGCTVRRLRNRGRVSHVAFDDLDLRRGAAEVVALRFGIEHDNVRALGNEALDDERSDKPSSAGNEEALAAELHGRGSYSQARLTTKSTISRCREPRRTRCACFTALPRWAAIRRRWRPQNVSLDSRASQWPLSRQPTGITSTSWCSRVRAFRREFRRGRFLLRALREFDVIHFNFGSSIAPRHSPAQTRERTLATRIHDCYTSWSSFATSPPQTRRQGDLRHYQGDDARPGDPHFEGARRRSIAVFNRYADGIFALNPDLLRFLPPRAQFLPYASVDPRLWRPSETARRESGPLRIVHAPSDRAIKGTNALLEAVARLRRDRYDLDLVLSRGSRTLALARCTRRPTLPWTSFGSDGMAALPSS